MRDPIGTKDSLPSNARQYSFTQKLVRARTISATWQVTFPSSGSGNCTGEVYYSPDGQNWDTIQFGTVTITLTASAAVQITAFVVLPEHGFYRLAVLNSNANPVTDVKMWSSIQSYDDPNGGYARGSLETGLGAE